MGSVEQERQIWFMFKKGMWLIRDGQTARRRKGKHGLQLGR